MMMTWTLESVEFSRFSVVFVALTKHINSITTVKIVADSVDSADSTISSTR